MPKQNESLDQPAPPEFRTPNTNTLGQLGKTTIEGASISGVEPGEFDITLVSPTLRLNPEQTDMLRVMSLRAGTEISSADIRKLAAPGSIPSSSDMFKKLVRKLRNDSIWSELLRDNGRGGAFKLWSIDRENLEAELRIHGSSLPRLSDVVSDPVADDSPQIEYIAPAQNRLKESEIAALQRLNNRGEGRRMKKYLDEAARADRRKKRSKG